MPAPRSLDAQEGHFVGCLVRWVFGSAPLPEPTQAPHVLGWARSPWGCSTCSWVLLGRLQGEN